MAQQYTAQAPVFGKRQGGMARPRQYQTAQPYAQTRVQAAIPVQQNPNYADIVGNGFTGNAEYDVNSAGYGSTINARPVKGLRFASGLIDFCISSLIGGVIMVVQHGPGVSFLHLLQNGGIINYYLWFGICCFIYGLTMESAFQGTVGKLATGTVVVSKDGQRMSFGQAAGRNLGKCVSFFSPAGIAYFMVLFTKENQSLHDKMAGTLVYRKSDVR